MDMYNILQKLKLIKSAGEVKDDLSKFLGASNDINDLVAQEIKLIEEKKRQIQAKEIAEVLIELSTRYDQATVHMVGQIRHIRQQEQNLLAKLKQLNIVQEYSAETGDYLPLAQFLARVLHFDITAANAGVPPEWLIKKAQAAETKAVKPGALRSTNRVKK